MTFRSGNSRAAKLTASEVYELRRLYLQENWTQGRLARHFQVGVGQVGRIVRGEAWARYQRPDDPGELEQMRLEAAILDATPLSEAEAKAIEESQRKLMELLK